MAPMQALMPSPANDHALVREPIVTGMQLEVMLGALRIWGPDVPRAGSATADPRDFPPPKRRDRPFPGRHSTYK